MLFCFVLLSPCCTWWSPHWGMLGTWGDSPDSQLWSASSPAWHCASGETWTAAAPSGALPANNTSPQSYTCGHYHHLLHYDTVWVGPSISVSWHSLLGLIILNLEEEFVLKFWCLIYFRWLTTVTCFNQIPALMNVGVWIIVESIMDRTLSKFSLNLIKINFIL